MMEKKRNFTIQYFILTLILLTSSIVFAGTPITISIDELEFNSGHLLEPSDVSSNDTDLSEYFAFYISETNNNYVDVVFSSNCNTPVTLIINAYASGNGLGDMCKVIYNHSFSSTPISMTFNGAVPTSITKKNFSWNWSITAIPCNTSSYDANTVTASTSHNCYAIYDEPVAPMDPPWVGVLDYACSWAGNQSTVLSSMQKIVEGLYNYSSFQYDTERGASLYTGKYDEPYNLTSMLSDFGTSQIVNCYDMGKAVHIFSTALGCDSYYALSDPFGYLNCIKAIGREWSNNPFYDSDSPYISDNIIVGEDDNYDDDGRSFFGNHAFCKIGDIIYDACLKVDTDSNPDAPTHTESWATGWSWNVYKTNVVDDVPSSSTANPSTLYSDDYIVY